MGWVMTMIEEEQPTFYEVRWDAHESWADSEEAATYEEAVEQAEAIEAWLDGQPDLASWDIFVLPHWCPPDNHPTCSCENWRTPKQGQPWKSFTGLVINF